MRLRTRFLQLPIHFDAERLAEEVAAVPESAWRPHPEKFPGNDALLLITTDGDPASDARSGKMAPTPHILACPYTMEVLDALGATWGRSRLMRLTGEAKVSPHIDINYYWRDHMRVHVPIVTQPTVRFCCGDEEVNMAAGEAWIFDTWSVHSVHNDALRPRIHLVADTVGGDRFLDLMEKGRSPGAPIAGWSSMSSPPRGGPPPKLAFENYNLPKVMTPWELRDHLGFLLSEVLPGEPQMPGVAQKLNRLRMNWHALWSEVGDHDEAPPRYASLLAHAWGQLEGMGVNHLPLRNGMTLGPCLRALIFDIALGGAATTMDRDARSGPSTSRQPLPAPMAEARRPGVNGPLAGRDPVFHRPIFIVSAPRSGSTLLFECLSKAPGLFTIGGESHALMEAIPQLGPAAHAWDSNRLGAADATPAAAAELRQRFFDTLHDRDGAKPPAGPFRMLEKTPKNSLRIPFLATVFPEARFIYLHRDAGPTLASMMEAWSSGHFQTYPNLPGWAGLAWSLLLVPGWRDLIGAPLNRIVAHQWAATIRFMLNDLETLPRDRWVGCRYESFIASPQAEIAKLCAAMGLDWDTQLEQDLPLSGTTVSRPNPRKWRLRSEEIEAVRPIFNEEDRRSHAWLEALARHS